MKINKYIPILFLLTLLSCSKCKEDKIYPTYYMDQEFKDYVVFPVGSYWIYEDSASGAIDSLYLFQQSQKINDRKKIVNYNYESISQNIYTSYYLDTLLGTASAEIKGLNPPYCIYSEGRLHDFLNVSIQYFGPSSIGETLYFNENLNYQAYMDTITLQGVKYNSVKIFQNLIQKYSYQFKKVYWGNKIGILRKELYNGQVWKLKKYYINN